MREHGLAMLLGIGVLASLLLVESIVLFFRETTASSFLQLLDAGALALVVLTHFAEALDLVSWMRWTSTIVLVTIWTWEVLPLP